MKKSTWLWLKLWFRDLLRTLQNIYRVLQENYHELLPRYFLQQVRISGFAKDCRILEEQSPECQGKMTIAYTKVVAAKTPIG